MASQTFQGLKRHQFLLEELVKRDFKKKYKGTLMGAAWSILNPLLMLLIMRVVFTHFFGDIEHYTTYLFCGTVVFTYFTEATSEGLLTLVGNANIFTKIDVPKYLFLVSKNVQTLLNFALVLVVFFVFCAFDGITFTWRFLALVYPIAMLLVFNVGLGLVLSALYVLFRDMQYLWTVFSQLVMYVSAVFYPIDTFPPAVQHLFMANPLFLFINYFRMVVIDGAIPSLGYHALVAAFAAGALLVGICLYRKLGDEFLYYV